MKLAIIINLQKYSVERLNISNPHDLEICWALAKPKSKHAKVSKIILCSFYHPPRSKKKDKLIDHIICTLQLLTAKYPECCICIGGDKNNLDVTPILNSNMKLVQMVTKCTRKDQILDIFITNMSHCYNEPIILPPVQPDDPNTAVASDHHVPLCFPHTDPHCPPRREYKTVNYRPLPDSKIRSFGNWITSENWEGLSQNSSPEIKVEQYNKLVLENLDKFLPTKTLKIKPGDKPFITAELKTLKRQRQREYCKRKVKLKNMSNC